VWNSADNEGRDTTETAASLVRLMGNSLLDVCVFGRVAKVNAGFYAKEKTTSGRLTSDEVLRYHFTPIPKFVSVS